MPNMLIDRKELVPDCETRPDDLIAHNPPAGCILNEGLAAIAVPLKDELNDRMAGASILCTDRAKRGGESIADAFLLFLSPSFFFRLP
jgi:hypothetical protein